MLGIVRIFYFSLVLAHGYGDIKEILLRTDDLKQAEANANIYIDTESQTASLNERLHIVLPDYVVKRVTCSHHRHLTSFSTSSPYNGRNTVIIVDNVTHWMSGTWICDVIEQKKNYDFYIHHYIYFDIKLLDNEPPQTILINNVIQLPKKQDFNRFTSEYYYEEGDTVDVLCISNKINNCNLQLSYNAFYSENGSKLKLIQNNSILVCTCFCSQPKIFSVTFVLQSIKDNMHLEVNGVKAKQTFLKQDGKYTRHFYINYGYISNNEEITILGRIDSNIKDAVLQLFPEPSNIIGQVNNGIEITFIIIPNKFSRLTFSMKNSSNCLPTENLIITFTQIILDENIITKDIIKVPPVTSTPAADSSVTDSTVYTNNEEHLNTSIHKEGSNERGTSSFRDLGSHWIPIVIGIVVMIILLSISIFIYKMRKRRLLERDTESYLRVNELYYANPSSPKQSNSEPLYMYPELQMPQENAYSIPDENETIECSHNNDYQNLQIIPDVHPVKEMYAEVLPKHKRNEEITYANISRNETNKI